MLTVIVTAVPIGFQALISIKLPVALRLLVVHDGCVKNSFESLVIRGSRMRMVASIRVRRDYFIGVRKALRLSFENIFNTQ